MVAFCAVVMSWNCDMALAIVLHKTPDKLPYQVRKR